ncbi:Cytochrome P450, E-class, group I [Trema orientale]|uniref:Cytochrome P450, E-class, group I n=1 Tax=Trema orientale TaxID=63057 RepID=A0A2P5C745_TREOI|nr:Cytochrome P450, E-class, group I [Trema orientale]
MELDFGYWVFSALMGGIVAVILVLKRANEWYHICTVAGRQCSLPPGDMGWPLIGNMWSFLIAFKFGHPDSFISNFIARFGRTGIYKAYLFGCPTIIVTAPETCRPVLMDDAQFKPGWPKSTSILMGRKSFLGLSAEEHKRLRRLTAALISGLKALSVYHEFMKDVILSSLDELAKADRPVEFLTEIRKITFKIIMYVFLSCEGGPIIETMEEEYAKLNYGLRSMAINLPGFAYHKALKARKNLVKILQGVIDGRRATNLSEEKTDMMDLLLDVEDENGEKLDDEEIIDVILMYLNAGHESTAHATLWATLFLREHPEHLQRAKAEQEEILRTSSATEKGLSIKETKQMEYLSKEGKPKRGAFIPFGTGSRLCPGSDLAKLELSTFLHYFLLHYELERLNPRSAVRYLPHTRPKDNCLAKVKKLPSPSST